MGIHTLIKPVPSRRVGRIPAGFLNGGFLNGGTRSLLGYIKDYYDVKAVVVLPELQADEEEGELELGWDKVL